MKLIQIVPREETRLYGEMVKKEAEIRRRNRGTFFRSGKKIRDSARWKHKKFNGWLNLKRGLGETVTAEIQSRAERDEWEMLSAFLGWLDRHFQAKITSVSIHYR